MYNLDKSLTAAEPYPSCVKKESIRIRSGVFQTLTWSDVNIGIESHPIEEKKPTLRALG